MHVFRGMGRSRGRGRKRIFAGSTLSMELCEALHLKTLLSSPELKSRIRFLFDGATQVPQSKTIVLKS